jgi:hypothetical protein
VNRDDLTRVLRANTKEGRKDKHPAKSFIGRTEKMFDFLGYRLERERTERYQRRQTTGLLGFVPRVSRTLAA